MHSSTEIQRSSGQEKAVSLPHLPTHTHARTHARTHTHTHTHPHTCDKAHSSYRRTSEWYSEVKGAGLSPEQAQQLQTSVQGLFQDWLETTGHGREIRELELPKTIRTKKPCPH